MKPSDIFKKHFFDCFIDDRFRLKNVDEIGEDNIAYECDYPHSIKRLTPTQIDKATHLNAMRFFRFDPFKHHRKEDLTVRALRAKAVAKGVDVAPRSSAGLRPVDGSVDRPITSGDMVAMFRHADELS